MSIDLSIYLSIDGLIHQSIHTTISICLYLFLSFFLPKTYSWCALQAATARVHHAGVRPRLSAHRAHRTSSSTRGSAWRRVARACTLTPTPATVSASSNIHPSISGTSADVTCYILRGCVQTVTRRAAGAWALWPRTACAASKPPRCSPRSHVTFNLRAGSAQRPAPPTPTPTTGALARVTYKHASSNHRMLRRNMLKQYPRAEVFYPRSLSSFMSCGKMVQMKSAGQQCCRVRSRDMPTPLC